MKNTIALTLLFFALIANAQKRKAYVLIKEKKGNSWSCPDQQIDYRVHFLNSKMDYTKRRKVLDVFINRFKGSEKNIRIKDYEVWMQQDDYLVFYEYVYKYTNKKDSKCNTNHRTIIKGFPLSNIEDVEEKLANKLKVNLYRDKYVSSQILDIKKPFVSDGVSYLQKLEEYFRKKGSKVKIKKYIPTVAGPRG